MKKAIIILVVMAFIGCSQDDDVYEDERIIIGYRCIESTQSITKRGDECTYGEWNVRVRYESLTDRTFLQLPDCSRPIGGRKIECYPVYAN